jgi:hypothetical protein
MVRNSSAYRANTCTNEPERDGRRTSALPTLPFIVAEVIDFAYPVGQDAIRSDEVVWID